MRVRPASGMLGPMTEAGPALSTRATSLTPSATVAISQRARELRAQGVDVLSFSLGEPDFDPPAHVLEAVRERLSDSAVHHYTAVGGIPELKEAIADDSAERRGGHRHEPGEIVVSVGAKHSLFNLAMALCEPGTETIVPAPHWVSYPAQVRLLGAEPIIVPTTEEAGFRLTPEQLEGALTPKTRMLILCSPSNPTGAAYDRASLEGLAAVLRQRPDVWVVVDEIYGRLVYGDFAHVSLLEAAPELRERLVIVDGVSKTYAMTGWRIGWMLAPRPLAAACEKLQGQGTTNPTAIAQVAAAAALRGPQEPVAEMRAAFAERRKLLVEGLASIDGLSCRMPEGAFYAFPSVEALLGKKTPSGDVLEDDLGVASFLLDEARCAVVPGTAFGAPGFLRISYAAGQDKLDEGLRRIREAVGRLS